MRRYLQWLLAAAMLSWAIVPARAFDDAAFCKLLTQFAAKTNTEKLDAPDPLTSNDAMVVDCDRKMVEFRSRSLSAILN